MMSVSTLAFIWYNRGTPADSKIGRGMAACYSNNSVPSSLSLPDTLHALLRLGISS